MGYFWETVDTVPPGIGFSHFGAFHLGVLAVCAALTALLCRVYRGLDEPRRARLRWLLALAMIADEMFKDFGLLYGGNYAIDYLPLHLCSINIFLIALHTWRSSRLLGGFLYFFCLPAACAALLFPTWTALPPLNFMTFHSFSVHLLLAAYPFVLTVCGDIRPRVRDYPRCLALLAAMAVPVWGFNRAFGTNFMFLMRADEGNPLKLFERFGSHLLGYPVLMLAVFALMSLPLWLRRSGRTGAREDESCPVS